ncbi:Unknown protein [Striga hermonthica]|uniref:Uncharacterized protein n=1 Tax=Striga hermonthica TaxID=68872 RepID=A0A9N7N7M4_STRHE|nr:Unknown protein [Striga hermonthica]
MAHPSGSSGTAVRLRSMVDTTDSSDLATSQIRGRSSLLLDLHRLADAEFFNSFQDDFDDEDVNCYANLNLSFMGNICCNYWKNMMMG